MILRIRGGQKPEIPVKEGQSILAALKEAEIYLTASCGGKGVCGKCKVKLLEGPAEITGFTKLSREERDSGIVLACRSFPKGDVGIEIPETSRIAVGEKIAVSRGGNLQGLVSAMGGEMDPAVRTAGLKLVPPAIGDNSSDLERLRAALEAAGVPPLDFPHDFIFLNGMGRVLRQADWDVDLHYAAGSAISLDPRSGSTGGRYGIAVDIGTTTVVVYLVDLSNGKLVEAGSTYNSQIRFGDDVITRIVHATERGGLSDLRQAVLEDINGLVGAISQRHALAPGSILTAVISGNTTMSHLFWGLDTASIREEPYVPGVSYFPVWRGGEAGLLLNPCGRVYTMPCMASYVGGDIVSGILASGMTRNGEIALFMDIGTNGEVAVGNDEWLITAACSAGPCFEGSGIRHGMRATEGAIESVRIKDGRVETGVVGGAPGPGAVPRGICGSGMIDAVSEMLLSGIIDRKGNFNHADGGGRLPESIAKRLRAGQEGDEFVLASGPAGQIALTQVDIENILRAKAAVYAGVSTLVKEVGLTLSDIEKVYIAGGFGNYLNVEKAVILGMLPDIPMEKYVFLGNTSITGAYLALVSEGFRREAEQIASRMTYMELSVSPGFMSEYMSALFLPHTDSSQFPTVEKLLAQKGASG
ncbi:MAG: ASKHA domain-containing protein [Nitrospiraceae bacterium]|nr:ASKHA domain-containing protein [Nitrospiraceae bacterium]